MWLTRTSFFILATGVSLTGLIITLTAGFAYSEKEKYITPVMTCAGLGLYTLFEGMGIDGHPEFFSYAYALLVLTASMLPWVVRRLINEKQGMMLMFLPILGILFASFAFSRAFPGVSDFRVGFYKNLALKWAFVVISVFTVISVLSAGIWSLKSAIRPGRSETFKRGIILAAGSLFFAVSIVLQAFADCKTTVSVNGWGGAGTIMLVIAISLIPIIEGMNERHALEQCHKNIEKQEFISIRDPLTGLFNRGYFFENLNQAIERLKRGDEFFGLIMLDLDDFKHINDKFGHPAGDYCLSAVGKVIMRRCRAYDCPARYGGDEFIILVTCNSDKISLEEIASRMYKGTNNLRLHYGTSEITINATMGVILVKDKDMRADKIVRMVDEAMYRGKKKGKGQMVTI